MGQSDQEKAMMASLNGNSGSKTRIRKKQIVHNKVPTVKGVRFKLKNMRQPELLIFDRYIPINNPILKNKKIRIGEKGKPDLKIRKQVEDFLIQNKQEVPPAIKIIINYSGMKNLGQMDSDKRIMEVNGDNNREQYLESVLRHEIEHQWFHDRLKQKNVKLQEYIKAVQKLVPFSINTEMYYEIMNGRKPDVTDLGEIKYGIKPTEYADEFHSETAEYLEYVKQEKIQKQKKTPYFITDEKALEKAVELYNKLHSN